MIPELGNFALILALCVACVQAIIPLLGIQLKQPNFIAVARPATLTQFLLVLWAFCCLAYAFIHNDFSVVYVAANSNTQLPLIYKITAIWGAHEGSVLLWVLILALWSSALALSNTIPMIDRSLVLSILGGLSVGFLLFLILESNPFQRYLPNFPLEGADLNPLLQDPGLAIHPPMLYMGYVGFSVTFAFAMAALWRGNFAAACAAYLRPWVLAAWCFLTLGITLGSWWAYRVLGWGGWWFWDPVENAALLPWLSGTALIHSLLIVEKRNTFKSWTLLLAIITFSLSLLGTFLVRSGILISVHAFANDPARGRFLLLFLTLVIGFALFLFAVRAPKLAALRYFSFCSRETLLLVNNVLLVVLMATILLGTIYPLMLDALNLGKISVGPPYFNTVLVPLSVPLLFFMGIGPLCYWREMPLNLLLKRMAIPLIIAIGFSYFILQELTHHLPWYVFLGLILASWVMFATAKAFILQVKHFGGIANVPRNKYGMLFAHLGIAICVVGITFTLHYQLERDVIMQPGDNVIVGPYEFRFLGFNNIQGENYDGTAAEFVVADANSLITILEAEKRIYSANQVVKSEAAIDAGIWRDLYVSLGDPVSNTRWSVRIYYKPFVRWIWMGGLFMILGGILAMPQRKKDGIVKS